jgi:enoyl-CoA hydratase
MNALNQAALQELWQAVSLFEADREVAALCFTGTGSRAFCAGLELGALQDMEPLAAFRLAREGQSLVNRIEGMSKPALAAVNGLALGAGFEMILACDLVAAAPGAAFGFPEVRVGMIPAWGGTRRLAEVVGRRKVKELVYTGELLSAEQALTLGVINAVVPAEELLEKIAAWVEKLSAGGRLALWQAKKVLDREGGMSQERAQDLEAECFATCFSTPELRDRVQEYVGRRTAAAAPAEAPAPAVSEPAEEETSTDDFFE